MTAKTPGTSQASGCTVRIDDLRTCLTGSLEKLGLSPDDAFALAGLLVDSELRGHPDHGAAALELLARLYRQGALNPRPDVKVLSETGSALLLDGDRGCGPAAPMRAMRWCVEHARERKGMAVAAVRDWQLLVAGPYARLAAEEGMVGFASTNYSPLVAPPGTRTAVLGTNPLAYALPASRHAPVVLDMATTNTAAQKMRVAAERGTAVSEGLLLDKRGEPSTDPADFLDSGLMAPLGHPTAAHKGFGLALVVEALTGVLSGSASGLGVAGEAPGSLLWALDVEAFMPLAEFCHRMDAQLDQVKQAERLPGVDEVTVPGERGARRHAELSARGVVPLSPESWAMLAAVCDSLDAPLPPPTDR